jgi:hypothetical protein
MFERYTEKARRTIFFARYEASQFGAQAIEAEHILLGLLRDDKQLAQHIFSTPYSEIEAIRKAIEATDPWREKISASVDLPLSAAAKRVLSYAADESDRLGDRHIGTEHLLLGILREDSSLAARLLAEHGVTAEKVIAAVTDAARAPQDTWSLSGSVTRIELGAGGGRLFDPILLQFFQQFRALIHILVERGIISQEEGQEKFGWSPTRQEALDWSPMRVNLMALLDMLVSKGVISEEEKQRIVEAKL